MSLMSRASLVVKAKLSRALDNAESPDETLDYSYERQLELLRHVKHGIADVVTAKKRLQLQASQLEQSVPTLESQARQAVTQQREDLARAALERKALAQTQLQALDAQVEQLEGQQEKLIASERQLAAKVGAFRTQKEVIKAQYSAAEAQVRIGEAVSGIGEQMADTGLAIQRARDKTDQLQARAEAMGELISTGGLEDVMSGETPLDRELGALGTQTVVDSELARLKSELGAAPSAAELEAPADAGRSR